MQDTNISFMYIFVNKWGLLMSRNNIIHPLKSIINVKGIHSIHYFEFKSDFKFEGESHNFWELVYVDKGCAIATAGTQKHILSQGEILFHKPDEFHSIEADRNDPPNVFIITFDCDSPNMKFFHDKRMSVPALLKKYITEIFANGMDTFYLTDDNPYSKELVLRENYPFGSEQLIKINLEILLLKLIRYSEITKREPDESENYDKLTRNIVEILKNSIYGKVTVENICQELGFSRAYVSARFKEKSGKTITEYLSDLKIREAKYLIRKDQHTITEIAEFLCFENPQYFCRVFKKITKMTPTQYKRSVSYKK